MQVELIGDKKNHLKSTSPVANATCPVCKSDKTRRQAAFRFEHSMFFGCSRMICGECQMIFTAPMPTNEDLSNYNANYFTTAHGGHPSSPTERAFFMGIARIRVAFIKRYLVKHSVGVQRVLELGPGSGFFAKSWLEGAPHDVYSAIETDRGSHDALTKLGIKLINSGEVVQTDLVVMSHVLEHVPDPFSFVRLATRGLKQGGAIFIEVPCRDWEHKALDEPHILFFDKAPMFRLLDDLGFTNIEIGYYGKTIAELKTVSILNSMQSRLRAKLLSWGLVAPFSSISTGLEELIDPLERAVVSPYMAHIRSDEPAWWLRAVALKA